MKRAITSLVSAAMVMISIIVLAQQSIDWQTVDGGGSVASGGSFSLKGSIGQPDGGTTMSGGAFSVNGGFWVPTVVQVPGAPTLYIQSTGGGMVSLWWAPADSGWILQESPSLIETNWTDSASGTTNPISIPISYDKRFFRLRRQP